MCFTPPCFDRLSMRGVGERPAEFSPPTSQPPSTDPPQLVEGQRQFRLHPFSAAPPSCCSYILTKIVTFVATGALNRIARWYDPAGNMSAEEVARSCVDTLIEGLAPQEAGGRLTDGNTGQV